MAVAFTTWLWGDKYTYIDVMKLYNGIRRNWKEPFRFVLITDQNLTFEKPLEVVPIPDPCLATRSCFCRLRMFDPVWQAEMGFDDRIVNMDLDVVVTGKLEPLFNRPDSFLILQGVNASNPNPFNCSIFMIRAGHHREVWDDFTPEAAAKIPRHDWADDQGWLSVKLPNASGWRGGRQSGIYAFNKPGWPGGTEMPMDARIVVFFGSYKPARYANLPWMVRYWRTDA